MKIDKKGISCNNLIGESFKLYLLNLIYEQKIISDVEYYKIKEKINIFNITNIN